MYRLDNPVRDYAWGSTDAIQQLLGRPETGDPAAELWMGTHAGAPSRIADDGQPARTLADEVAADPETLLGPEVAAAFDGRLPYLFKVLAAAKPLSLQAHPSLEQAASGYAAEEAAGVARDDPARNYRDDQAKPELIAALTPFEALCGFADPVLAAGRIEALGLPELEPVVGMLRAEPGPRGIARALTGLLGPDGPVDPALVDRAVERATELSAASGESSGPTAVGPSGASSAAADPLLALLPRLARDYPGDRGVLVALLCNHVELTPGQALYLPAGNLHAYCAGVGVELMNASDNVLRGGLTDKHVDVRELLRVLDTTPRPAIPLEPERVDAGRSVYRTDARSFELSRVEGPTQLPAAPQIVLAVAGSAVLSGARGRLRIDRGESVFAGVDDGSLAVDELEPGTLLFRAAPPVDPAGPAEPSPDPREVSPR